MRSGREGQETIVATDPPALRPIGMARQHIADAVEVILETPAFADAAPGPRSAAELHQPIRLGTPLERPGLARLQSVTFGAAFPADHFASPAVPPGLPEIEETIRTATPATTG